MMRVCMDHRDGSATIFRVQVLICFGILISAATSCGSGTINTPPPAPPSPPGYPSTPPVRYHLVAIIKSPPRSPGASSSALGLG